MGEVICETVLTSANNSQENGTKFKFFDTGYCIV